jgi:hypothetical protein
MEVGIKFLVILLPCKCDKRQPAVFELIELKNEVLVAVIT